MPYINRAFNRIKLYVYNQQRFSEANRILEQIYSVTFLKRLLMYIEEKENYNNFNNENEDDKIIEEEKEYQINLQCKIIIKKKIKLIIKLKRMIF